MFVEKLFFFLCNPFECSCWNQEDFDDKGILLLIESEEQFGNMNKKKEYVRRTTMNTMITVMEYIVYCNGFDLSKDSPRRADDEDNFLVSDNNDVK